MKRVGGAVLAALVFCALLFSAPTRARAETGWTLRYEGAAILAPAMDFYDRAQSFETKRVKRVELLFSCNEVCDRFFLSFLDAPAKVEVYAARDGEAGRLLASAQPEAELFVIDLPAHAETELLFACAFPQKARHTLDGFAPVWDGGQSLPALVPASRAGAVAVLPAAALTDAHRQGLADVLAAYPDAVPVVVERTDTAQRHAFLAEWRRLGGVGAPIFGACKASPSARWNRDKLNLLLASALRALRPAVALTPAPAIDEACAAALATALSEARALAADAAWEHAAAVETGLWYTPALGVFPSAGALVAMDESAARAASDEAMRALVRGDWDGEGPDWAALGVQPPQGFLAEGEQVYANPSAGAWTYQSAALCLTISRYRTKSDIWLEADLRVNPQSGERLRQLAVTDGELAGRNVYPAQIAAVCKAVFAINADYYAFRRDNRMKTGNILRAGQALHTADDGKARRAFPPLDELALLADGSLRVFAYGEKTMADYLAMGAYDVYSFGPILVRGGERQAVAGKLWRVSEPRCALGMTEPYHYLAVMVEGRLNGADGCGLQALADLLWLRGATEALNLDGGHTAVMYFLGERLSEVGSYGGGTSSPRRMNELIGAGVSDRVTPAD